MLATILAIAMLLPASPAAATETGWQSACGGGSCLLPQRPTVPVVRPAAAARPHAAVARIVNSISQGIYHGSGTLIAVDGNGALLVTCKHLFRDGVGKIVVTFPDGKNYRGQLAGVDAVYDVAAVRIARPAAAPVAIAATAPRPGEPLWALGYAERGERGGRFMATHGRCRGYVRAEGTPDFKTLDMSGSALQGMSGGPILNSRWQLAAVLWGTNSNTVAGTFCGRISKFVEQFKELRTEGNEGKEDTKKPLLPSLPSVNDNFPLLPELRTEGNEGNEDTKKPLLPSLPSVNDNFPLLPELRTERNEGKEDTKKPLLPSLPSVNDNFPLLPELRTEGNEGNEDTKKPLLPLLPSVNDNFPSVGDRLGDLLAGLAERLDRLQEAPPIARSVAEAVPATSVVSLINIAAAALGYSTPPAALMWMGVTLLRRWRRKKSVPKREQNATLAPLNDNYAQQLADVFALSGHSQVADATLGREYDEELRRAEQSSNGNLAGWARDLRERVAQRFYRIHGRQPMPAEPVDE